MSLIRNGGFERGNTQFWEVIQGGTLEIDNTNQKYGNYCGKFTASGTSGGAILSSDYVDVKPYQIVDTIFYMKTAASRSAYLILYTYDADYSFIESQTGVLITMDGTYKRLHDQFMVPAGCAYVRFGIKLYDSAPDEVFYIDGAGLDIVSSDGGLSGEMELLPYGAYTASGNTLYDADDMRQFSTYYAQLYCGNVSGTSPTLDVEIREQTACCHSLLVGTFSQFTAAGDERIALNNAQGKWMYVTYTIGGTNPEFDFRVRVFGKR